MIVSGTMIANRYEIIEKIGSGGMADVYKATDKKLNRQVAIKVLKSEFSADATFVKKFRIEAQAAAGLSHPNIVNVYDVGEEMGIHYIVMELVVGITLKKYIEMKGKLEIREALNISVQIASGLQAAHDNRIIHRDIKPQNIIMSRDGKVKVTDFGIAKMADSTTVTTNAAGSVHYISPEQARGGYSDEKSDIYSLGITMYEMLTGQVPFEGETNVAVALMHIQDEIIPPRRREPSIPISYEKIILKCTQKKPELRYASAKDLITDLRKVLTHPDGAYVVLPGYNPVPDETVVLEGTDLDQTVLLDTTKTTGADTATTVLTSASGTSGNARTTTSSGTSGNGTSDSDDDDDEEGNPALEKVMMVLGIIGAVILVVAIIFILGRVMGVFSAKETETETQTESMTETETEMETETETETTVQVTVPDLYDLTQEEAEQVLKEYNLYMSVKSGSDEDVDKDHIYKQSPEEGETVSEGDTITVWINDEEIEVEVPDVEGLTLDQCRSSLETVKGLEISDIVYEYSDTIKANLAIRTDPEAGSTLVKGDSIVLYISLGPEDTSTTMPSVVGETLEKAKTKITNANLTVGDVTYEYSSSVSEGKVISASVSYGTTLEEGTSIDLVVSLGAQTEAQTTAKTYTATVTISDSPIGGLPSGSVATVVITVYKPDGSSEVILNGTFSVDDGWATVEETVTSTASGTGYYEIVVTCDGETSTDTANITFS